MNKIITLRNFISSTLKMVHPRVYYQWPPDKAVYPYLVFNLPNSIDDLTMEKFVLDIDGWDAPADGDTIPLENLMASVNNVLHRKSLVVEDMSMTFYLDNRLAPVDDDSRIRRRLYTYEVRTFGGEN